jgi:hypothetical protein
LLLSNQEDVSEYSDGPEGTLTAGTEYEYAVNSRVAVIDASKSGGYTYSKQSESGKVLALTLPDAPILTDGVCTVNSCAFSWNKIKSADSYDIYRENDLGQAVLLETITEVSADVLTYTDANLESNHKYNYLSKAHNRTGDSKFSNTLDLMTWPQAATNGTSDCTDASCDLTWDPNNKYGASPEAPYGMLTYAIEYRPNELTPEGAEELWRPATSTTALVFTKINLAGGTSYEWRVTSSNSAGSSLAYNWTGLTKPDAPEPTANCQEEKACTITWASVKSVTELNDSVPTGYRVQRHLDGDNELDESGQPTLDKKWVNLKTSLIESSDESAFTITDTGIKEGVALEYRVYAFNASGDSLPGYVGTVSLPAKIIPVANCSEESRTCNVSWAAGGANVIQYDIWRALPGDVLEIVKTFDLPAIRNSETPDSLDPTANFQASMPAWNDGGLLDGTDYIYAVTANAGGGNTNKVEAPALTVPGTPTQTGITTCTDIECTINYTRPKSTTYFNLFANILNPDDDTPSDSRLPVETNALTGAIGGLTPAKTAELTVFACNASGCGSPLAAPAATRPAGPLIIGQDGWNVGGVNSFLVQTMPGSDQNPTELWRCQGTGECAKTGTFIDSDVIFSGEIVDNTIDVANAKYCYTAIKASGESVMSCRFTPPIAPIVTNLDRSGEFLPGDTLRILGPNDTYVMMSGTIQMDRKATSNQDGLAVKGLQGNTQYCFTLRNTASEDTGNLRYDLAPYESSETCAWTAPDAPTSLTVERADNGSADLNWIAPAGDIENYIVEYKLISDASWTVFDHEASASTQIFVNNLSPAVTYQFRVKAVNPGGVVSAPSNIASYDSAATPDSVTGLNGKQIQTINGSGGTVSSYTSGGTTYTVNTFNGPNNFERLDDTNNVYLQWNAPLNNGGSAITDYAVNYRVQGSTEWVPFPHSASDLTFITVTDLLITQTYEFQIIAVNSVGQGSTATPVSVRVNFPTQYMVKGINSNINTNGDTVQNGSVATTQCPANMDLQVNGSCREITPASQNWGTTGYYCPSGGYVSGSTCVRYTWVSQGYNETYQTGTETYQSGSYWVDTSHWSYGGATNYWWANGGAGGWLCPAGWGQSGTTCYQWTVSGYTQTSYSTRPTYGTRWVDTSYNRNDSYGASIVEGWVNSPAPAGWSGAYPSWYRGQFFNANEMKNATWAVSPAGTPVKGTGSGDSTTYTPGSVTVRYESPYSGASAVTNLTANMDTIISGGVQTIVNGKTLQTFSADGGLQVTPGDAATLTWTSPANLNRGTLLDYKLEYRLQGATNWTNYPHGTVTTETAAIAGLTPGANYEFRVTPVTEFGLGSPATTTPIIRNVTVEIVAGGGSGGSGAGGAGGAGGYATLTFPMPTTPTYFPILVGAGGTTGNAGGNSRFGTTNVLGGGAGGSNNVAGQSGGSGGGGSYNGMGAAGTPGQGNTGSSGAGGGFPYSVGGGSGGAGTAAPNANSSGNWSSAYTYYSQTRTENCSGPSCPGSQYVDFGTDWSGTTCPRGGTMHGGQCLGWTGGTHRVTYRYKNSPPAGFTDPNDGTNSYYRIATNADAPGGTGITSLNTGLMLASGGNGGAEYSQTQGANGLVGTGNGGGGSASNKAGGTGGRGVVLVGYSATTAPQMITATGGSISTAVIGGQKYKIHAFANTSQVVNFTITSGIGQVEYLLVGGGGGGGARNYPNEYASGGGGAGGVLAGVVKMTASTTPITVGTPGQGALATSVGSNGGNGGNSNFGSLITFGGGGGAKPGSNGSSGGSGGGGSQYDSGSTGGSPQRIGDGYNGATTGIDALSAGGGGGAGTRGTVEGIGGSGRDLNWTGTLKTYGIGGNSGNAVAGVQGVPQSGNGGMGGQGSTAGLNGSSGAVILRYPTP